MKVNFVDLKAQYLSIKDEIDGAIRDVIDKTAFAGGPFVADFENDFASFCNCKYSIGTSSGTSALWLALLGLGVGQGDEVITSPNTFIATAEAISLCGAKPVFVDVDQQTYNINPALVEKAITSKTKVILPVHLYGQMADMDAILKIARKHGLRVVEDACQAHGAKYKGHCAGSMGDAGCFSFYPGKNLGAYGEAGAVVTNNAELVEKLRVFRDHGQQKKYYHSIVGWNCRMDGMQGAILKVKLKHLWQWNKSRRENAKLYNSYLKGMTDITTPKEADGREHVYHIYAVRTSRRDELMSDLAKQNIYCGIHYPVPLHLQKAYEFLGYKEGDFPVAEQIANEQVSLPMYAELTSQEIQYVCDKIKELRN
ncbi:MAG: DegT/DnrJ/EryC1/StrS family aminotransferase [Planctomycetaceae bacterium]|nr:DegT/DnrJ/EryC1/StrS family aminotransferase [Planctomycetaceae bacterium]